MWNISRDLGYHLYDFKRILLAPNQERWHRYGWHCKLLLRVHNLPPAFFAEQIRKARRSVIVDTTRDGIRLRPSREIGLAIVLSKMAAVESSLEFTAYQHRIFICAEHVF